MDRAWMRQQLEGYVDLLERHPDVFDDLRGVGSPFFSYTREHKAVALVAKRMAPTITKIVQALEPGRLVLNELPLLNSQRLEAARFALALLDNEQEGAARSGSGAPPLLVERFHPWVWNAARPLWNTGHHRPAVHAAASAISVETRKKLRIGRTGTPDTRLMKQAFRPTSTGSRYLKVDDEGGAGAEPDAVRDLAIGCFTAIRNPAGHPDGPDWPEQRALEYLAALSALARWIDGASVATS